MLALNNTRETFDITVLMGGPSSERDVSLMSGEAVATALESLGHHVTRADITPTNPSCLDQPGIDVVFIALHGDFGESGQVQELCEQRGLAYTGSGPRASRLGMDKAASKQIFKRAGLQTPDWVLVERYHQPADVARWLEEFPPPVVVKPVDGGSSVHVTICRDIPSRETAMDELLDFYGRVMVEKFVAGRELTVGILGTRALPVMEIVPDGEFYDYRAKYSDEAGTQYLFDHGLGEATCEALQADALKAHNALGCRDLSRVDIVLDAEGGRQVLEINTIPGFTSHSLVPKAAAQVGISFPALCDQLVRQARSRAMCAS